MTRSAPKTSPKTSHTSLLPVFTSWHHMPDVLDSESRVFIFSVDPNDTETQPVHGQDGSAWQRGPGDSRPGKDTKINKYTWYQTQMEMAQQQKYAYSASLLRTIISNCDGSRDPLPKEPRFQSLRNYAAGCCSSSASSLSHPMANPSSQAT